MSGVDLASRNFIQTTLIGANLSGCNLTGTQLPKDLTNVNMSGVHLAKRDFIQTTLIGANLSGANLSGANLSGANLSGATVTNSDFTNATLIGVTFPGGIKCSCNAPGTILKFGEPGCNRNRNDDYTYQGTFYARCDAHSSYTWKFT